jgi:hypothetical protein
MREFTLNKLTYYMFDVKTRQVLLPHLHCISVIIIMFMNCKWVDTGWQWSGHLVAVVKTPGGSSQDTRWQWSTPGGSGQHPVAVVIYE